ncbi:MAG: hypothetical protein Tsb0027_21960 [Wenzhouxiangellaceae bacterium]
MAAFSLSEISELALLISAGFAAAFKSGHTPDLIVAHHVDVNIVSGFNECIRITEGGMDYEVKEGKEGDSITIDVSYSRSYAPRAALSVTHLVINPSELKDKVVCEGPLAAVLDGNTVNITQAFGVQSVTCRPGDDFPRDGDNDFSIVLHTTVGTIEGFVKPFYKGKSDRLAVLEEKYENASEQISNINYGLSSANSTISFVNNKFSNIKFHKACVAREANSCNPIMPPCPGGWIDTGIDEVNTWAGGSCGHGHLCRVCYKVE